MSEADDKLDFSVKVSIITPAYNAESYIKETIESVRNQTYPNWEMIIVDDCSTDTTAKIVKEYSDLDDRIVYLKNDNNSGVAITRNVGIQYASGKYFAFLDSDDLWTVDKLLKQILFMEKKKCAFSFTAYQKFSSDTGAKGVIIHAPKSIKADEILGNTIIGCLTVMYNSEMVGKMMMPHLNHMEDNITWYNILSKGYTAYGIDEVLALYREGNNSLTSSKKKAAMQQWKVYREYFGFSVLKSVNLFINYAFHAVIKHYFNGMDGKK